MTMQAESSPNIGPTCIESATLESVEATTLRALMSSVADSPVKIFPTPDSGQVLMESEAGCSLKPFAWFDNSNQESLCWRTWQRSLLEDWTEYAGRWPRSGTTVNGIAYRLPTLVPRISGTGSLSSPTPTPTAGDAKSSRNATANRKPGSKHNSGTTLTDYAAMYPTPVASDGTRGGKLTPGMTGTSLPQFINSMVPTPTATDGNKWNRKTNAERRAKGQSVRLTSELDETGKVIGGSLNPQWVEWLMGFPSEWTALDASETP